jgi:two-component system, sensor histidine kinase YesM
MTHFKSKVASKFILTIVVVTLIPTIFISTFFYFSATNIVKENVRDSSRQIAKQAADSLSFILSTGSDMSDYIYSNEQIQEMVMRDASGELTDLEKSEISGYISSYLNSNIYSSSFVRIIYILKDHGTSWGSGTFSPYKLSRIKLEDLKWVQDSIKMDGEVVWEGLQYDRFSGAGENTELVLAINRVMKDFDTMNNIAFIQVSLDGREILQKINQVKLGKTGVFFVVDSEGKIMIDTEVKNINQAVSNTELYQSILQGTSEFQFTDNQINYYGVNHPIGNGWSIVGIVPVNEITGELGNIQKITILTSMLFGMVAVIIGLLISRRVTRPIKVLTNQMKLVGKGNFSVRTEVNSNDEIGIMSEQFNQMINQIENLLVQINEEQTQKKEAELRAIKHRINPHFLFNTLSTIRWLVQFNQTERANSALSALSKLLEAYMGKSGTFVPIKEELDIIEKFMIILQIRYEQVFHLKVKIDRNANEFLIPRMLLQPIVENAIFHGIVPTGREGTIDIRISKIVGGVEIKVRDDGKGFEKTVLDQLQDSDYPQSSSLGIGLSHVFDSVRLYFHPASLVNFTSSPEGTTVKLKLIAKDTGEQHV